MLEKVNFEELTSVDQMADFFDSVDTQTLEWEDTDAKFIRPEMVHISIRIPKEDLAALKYKADELGLGYTAYIRMLLHRLVGTLK